MHTGTTIPGDMPRSRSYQSLPQLTNNYIRRISHQRSIWSSPLARLRTINFGAVLGARLGGRRLRLSVRQLRLSLLKPAWWPPDQSSTGARPFTTVPFHGYKHEKESSRISPLLRPSTRRNPPCTASESTGTGSFHKLLSFIASALLHALKSISHRHDLSIVLSSPVSASHSGMNGAQPVSPRQLNLV
jgi:hypothetical protein